MNIWTWRAALLVAICTSLVGCGSDIRDTELSQLNQPENAQALLEQLSVEERSRLATYIAVHAARGDLDYSLSVDEALELAADELGRHAPAAAAPLAPTAEDIADQQRRFAEYEASERARYEEQRAALQRGMEETSARLQAQRDAREAERQEKLAPLLAQTTAAMWLDGGLGGDPVRTRLLPLLRQDELRALNVYLRQTANAIGWSHPRLTRMTLREAFDDIRAGRQPMTLAEADQ